MKVHCLKCGKLLAEPDAKHPKGKVKCGNCRTKFKYKLKDDDSITIIAKGKNLPCNNVVDITGIIEGV